MAIERRRYAGGDPDDSIEDEIGGYTPGAGPSRDTGPKPLGVPAGYSVPAVRMPGYSHGFSYGQGRYPGAVPRPRLVEQGPRYVDGDEWRPAAQGPESITEIQRALTMAGYLGPRDRFRLGAWDETTRNAYRSLLEEANASGLNADAMAAQRAASFDVGGSGQDEGDGAGGYSIDPNTGELVPPQFVPPPLELRTTSKADLARLFRGVVIDKLGEGWSQAEINELVDAYNWREIQVQKDAYDEEVARQRAEFMGEAPSSEPITMVDVESPETFVENELMRRDPESFQAGQIANDYAPAFFSALEGYV
jgi:hypothetical protein